MRFVDPTSVSDAIEECAPQIVINALAVASVELCEQNPLQAFEVNASWPRDWAISCQQSGSRFLQISTDAVFDGERGHYSETDIPSPRNAYGASKLKGENLVLESCSNSLVMRTNFFGWSPLRNRGILDYFVNELTESRPVVGYTDYIVSSIYVDHLSAYILKLGQGQQTGLINVASATPLAKAEFGRLVATEFGLPLTHFSEGLASQSTSVSRGRNLSLNIELLEQVTHSSTPTTADGVRAAARAFV